MDGLLCCNRDIDQTVKRNIVSLRQSQDLFDDLTGDDSELSALAQALEMQVKKDIPTGVIARGFHYNTAIDYPFSNEPYLSSRFGNGQYPVWYGSLALETTIHETCFHMWREERRIEANSGVIYRERAVYDVDCRALLIDLTGQTASYPDLIADQYHFTQAIGQRLYTEGHPGLIATSARHERGENVAIFRPGVLSNPRISCYLTYSLSLAENVVTVERAPGETLMIWRC